jgi:hypothetical protein
VQDPRVQSVALLTVGQASPELESAWQEDPFLQENPQLLQVARLVASLEREFLRVGQLDQVPGVFGRPIRLLGCKERPIWRGNLRLASNSP